LRRRRKQLKPSLNGEIVSEAFEITPVFLKSSRFGNFFLDRRQKFPVDVYYLARSNG
jgi:hypothetical protein